MTNNHGIGSTLNLPRKSRNPNITQQEVSHASAVNVSLQPVVDVRPMLRTIQSVSVALGVTYGSASFAYEPLDCLNEVAEVDSSINVGLATKLCSAAWTSEPVKCYVLVSKVDDTIPRFIAIDLCAGTTDAEKTVECYVKAGTKRNLNRGLSTTLCGARKTEK